MAELQRSNVASRRSKCKLGVITEPSPNIYLAYSDVTQEFDLRQTFVLDSWNSMKRAESSGALMRQSLFLLWLIFLPSGAVSDDGHSRRDLVFTLQLDSALQKELENVRAILDSDNISASIYISDKCYWEGVAGFTKQNPEVPVNADMIYGFGSIAKTFVASIVLQLVEENRLNLEDPLGKWLPQYPNIDTGITIRELLNHGSGLDDFYLDKDYEAEVDADLDRVWLPEETLKYVGPPPRVGVAPPKYSNTNYILLGMVIEAATGNSLEIELQYRITRPLQLNSTHLPKQGFDPERWADNTHLSNSRFSSLWAAGAIASTAREIAKWSQVLYSGNFLEDASMKSMLATEPRRIGQLTLPMGLGVWKFEGDSGFAWGHGGLFSPFKSATFYVPKLGISIAYSFSWTDSGEQLLPGSHLVQAFVGNRPDDISICLD